MDPARLPGYVREWTPDAKFLEPHTRHVYVVLLVSSTSLRLTFLLLIYAAFVSMGLPDGILGAAWPQMRAELGVGLNDNWLMLLLGTGGASVSSFATGFLLRRLGIGRILVLTTLLTASVMAGHSASPTFALVTALAFFLGLGNGAIDAGLNHFAATNLSSQQMSWLHGFWGVGVSLGTLIVSGVFMLGGSWRAAYLALAALQLSLALSFALNIRSLPNSAQPANQAQPVVFPTLRATLLQPNAWVSIALFFTYCGLECSTGLWLGSVLHDGRGWSLEAAGLMATLYWASLTVGRFLTGFASRWMKAHDIVRFAVSTALVGTLLITWSSLAPMPALWAGIVTAFGLLLTGFSLSPIYPLVMHDTPRVIGAYHAINLIGFQGGAGQLGYTLIPIGVGALLQAHSTRWLGALLTVLAATLVVLLGFRARLSAHPSVK